MGKAKRRKKLDPTFGVGIRNKFVETKIDKTQAGIVDMAAEMFVAVCKNTHGAELVKDVWYKAKELYSDPCLLCCFKHKSKRTIADLDIMCVSFKDLSKFFQGNSKYEYPIYYKEIVNQNLVPIVFSSIDFGIYNFFQGTDLKKELPEDYWYQLAGIKLPSLN